MTRLIDADAFWASVIQSRKETIIDDDVKISMGEFVKLLDNAPTVEVRDNFDLGYIQGLEDGKKERPKGKWNVISLLRDYVYVRCSECGQDTRLVRDSKNEFCCIKDIRDKIVACPYCGADMREVTKND